MAGQIVSSVTNSMNYLLPYGDISVAADVQRLLSGELRLDDFGPLQELERIRVEGNEAYERTHFSNAENGREAEYAQGQINSWVNTARWCLTAVIHFYTAGKITC